ncbi:CCDC18 isoform 6, partial [Pan troglodytes]
SELCPRLPRAGARERVRGFLTQTRVRSAQSPEMESSSSDYYNKDNEEESLLANVASLRHELKITEWSLQSLGEELSRCFHLVPLWMRRLKAFERN